MILFNNLLNVYFAATPVLILLVLGGFKNLWSPAQKTLFLFWSVLFFVLCVINCFITSSRYLLLGTIVFFPLVPASLFFFSNLMKNKKSVNPLRSIQIGGSIVVSIIIVISIIRLTAIHSNPVVKQCANAILNSSSSAENNCLICFTTDAKRIEFILKNKIKMESGEEDLSTLEKCRYCIKTIQEKTADYENFFVLDREKTEDNTDLSFRCIIEDIYGFFPFDEIHTSQYRKYCYRLYKYNNRISDGIHPAQNYSTSVYQSDWPKESDFSVFFSRKDTPETMVYRSNWISIPHDSEHSRAFFLNQYNWCFSKGLISDSLNNPVLPSASPDIHIPPAAPHEITVVDHLSFDILRDTEYLYAEDFIGEPFLSRYDLTWETETGEKIETNRLPLDDTMDKQHFVLTIVDKYSGDKASSAIDIRKRSFEEGIPSDKVNVLMLFDKDSLNWNLGTVKKSYFSKYNHINLFLSQKQEKYEGRGIIREHEGDRSRWKNVFLGSQNVRDLISELTDQPASIDYQHIIISWGCGDILYDPYSYLISGFRNQPEIFYKEFIQILKKAYPDAKISLLIPPTPYLGSLSYTEGYCPWYLLRKTRCKYIQMLLRVANLYQDVNLIFPNGFDSELDYRKNSLGLIRPFSLTEAGRKKILSSILLALSTNE